MLDPKKLKESLGLNQSYTPGDPSAENLRDYINLKLAARGFQIVGDLRYTLHPLYRPGLNSHRLCLGKR